MWSLGNFLFWMDGLERLGSTGQELLDQRLSISGCMELGELDSSGRGFQIVSELVASPEVSKSSLTVKFFHQNPGFNCIFLFNLPRILTHWW